MLKNRLLRLVTSLIVVVLIGDFAHAQVDPCKPVPAPGDPTFRDCVQQAADDAYAGLLNAVFFATEQDDHCFMPGAGDECNYWQMGHAIDSALDYLDTTHSAAATFAGRVFIAYENMRRKPSDAGFANACWRDDFGWFTVAAQRATQQDFFSDAAKKRFQAIALEAWSSFQAATRVWDECQDTPALSGPPPSPERLCRSHFGSLEPRFDGGVWNYYWFNADTPSPTACNTELTDPERTKTPCDPTEKVDPLSTTDVDLHLMLCGRQNTVTNSLYYVAASRLSTAIPSVPQFEDAAKKENAFLSSWVKLDNADLSLINHLGKGAVVRERVSTFHGGDKDRDDIFRPDLAWAGDNGIFLDGLLAYSETLGRDSSARKTLLGLAQDITDGVKAYLGDDAPLPSTVSRGNPASVKRPYLLPWRSTPRMGDDPRFAGIGAPPGNDSWDHNIGTAVYLRSVLDAYKTNKELRKHLREACYPKFVTDWAYNIIMLRSTNPPLGWLLPCFGITCTPQISQRTNTLAVLVAAIEMANDAKNDRRECR